MIESAVRSETVSIRVLQDIDDALLRADRRHFARNLSSLFINARQARFNPELLAQRPGIISTLVPSAIAPEDQRVYGRSLAKAVAIIYEDPFSSLPPQVLVPLIEMSGISR